MLDLIRRPSLALGILSLTALGTVGTGCTHEVHRTLEPQTVESHNTHYTGPRMTIVVANFQNRSGYMQGVFSDGQDRLGSQAKTILKTHLQQTNRFTLVDRQNMQEIAEEAKISGVKQNLTGAQLAITGDVTEFGRRTVGHEQLFGIAGSGKTQTAYAKVALNVVDVATSEVIYSAQGAGEYALSNQEVLGFGSTASYDATLNGKVLNLAIMEVVNNLVKGLESGEWPKAPAGKQ